MCGHAFCHAGSVSLQSCWLEVGAGFRWWRSKQVSAWKWQVTETTGSQKKHHQRWLRAVPPQSCGDYPKYLQGRQRSKCSLESGDYQKYMQTTRSTCRAVRDPSAISRLPEVQAEQSEIQVPSADYRKYKQSSQRCKCHLGTSRSSQRSKCHLQTTRSTCRAVRDPSAICRLPEVHAEQSEMQVPSADYRKYKQSSQRSKCHLQTTGSTCRAVRDASAGRLPDVRAGQSKCRLEITRSTCRAVSDKSPVKRRVALQIACSIGRSLCQCDRLSAYRNTVACVCKKWPRLGYMYIQSISWGHVNPCFLLTFLSFEFCCSSL